MQLVHWQWYEFHDDAQTSPCHALDCRGCMCCHDKAHCIYFKLLIKTVCLELSFFHCALKKIEARGMMQKCALCVWDSGNDKIRRHIIYRTARVEQQLNVTQGGCEQPGLIVTVILQRFDVRGHFSKSTLKWLSQQPAVQSPVIKLFTTMMRDTISAVTTLLCCCDLYTFDAFYRVSDVFSPSTFFLLALFVASVLTPFGFGLCKSNESKWKEKQWCCHRLTEWQPDRQVKSTCHAEKNSVCFVSKARIRIQTEITFQI